MCNPNNEEIKHKGGELVVCIHLILIKMILKNATVIFNYQLLYAMILRKIVLMGKAIKIFTEIIKERIQNEQVGKTSDHFPPIFLYE